MLGFLVGNDFVPHLPNLHIREDALPTVYRCYKQVLPTLDGERVACRAWTRSSWRAAVRTDRLKLHCMDT